MIREIYDKLYGRVLQGPFKDMHYISNSIGSAYWPKILGTYEKELYPYIQNRRIDRVINVGAAEGYFAVGFKRYICPGAEVIAFEREERGQEKIKELAKKNKVYINLFGDCDPDSLRNSIGNDKLNFILIDVEGYEFELLRGMDRKSLQSSVLLIEIHDCFSEDVGNKIIHFLSETHKFKRIDIIDRFRNDLPSFLNQSFLVTNRLAIDLMNEHRNPSIYWLLFEAPDS